MEATPVITETELSFAAGLLEGEGSVRINRATKRNLGHLVCSVTNTDRELIDWLQGRWPAYMKPVGGLRSDQRPAWAWCIAARKAAAFLSEIRPFVVTTRMKKRIALAVEFQQQKSKCSRVSDEYRCDQWIYYVQMRELNLRGVHA
jgi:hypothetical protein